MLSATFPNQYGPPYSPKVGIQEAINYIAAIGGGTIKLNDGIYDETNAPFMSLEYNHYAQIVLPVAPEPAFNIAIIGNPASRGGMEGGSHPANLQVVLQ